MRKAFMEMDVSRRGTISPADIKYYLTHWGISTSDERFAELFNYFDANNDGEICYKDF